MGNYNLDERCGQIVTLLGYPRVGPLSVAAIATNLGAAEPEIQAALEALLCQGRIVQVSGERFARAPLQAQGKTATPRPAGNRETGLVTEACE